MFKDQTSLIVFIVAVLLGAIGIGTVYFTKPEPQPVTPVEPVPLASVQLPAGGVSYANALPGAGTSAAGAGGAPAGFGGGPATLGSGAGGPASLGGFAGRGRSGSGR